MKNATWLLKAFEHVEKLDKKSREQEELIDDCEHDGGTKNHQNPIWEGQHFVLRKGHDDGKRDESTKKAMQKCNIL